MSVTITIAVAVMVVMLVLQWKRKYRNMPPGPQPIPIIGNFHQIKGSSLAIDLTRIGKKYGDIFTVHFLMTPVIVMNSYKVIKDMLVSPEYGEIFSGRVVNYFSKHLLPNDMIFQTVTDGQQYMRRLVMRGIKQYGTSLKRVEHIAQQELGILIDKTREKKGDAFDPIGIINGFTTNIMMILVCGERFDGDHVMMTIASEVAHSYSYLMNYKHSVLMDMVPLSTKLHPGLKQACLNIIDNNHRFTEEITKLRKEGKAFHQDCLFALLDEEHKAGNITMENVKGILLDMLFTGVLTTTPTLYVALLAMAHYPNVQKKMQEEIFQVVGDARLPGLDDKPNLPYSNAAMLEVFRYFSPIPLPGPRNSIKGCTYRGYFIPKDTMAIYNVWNVHHDEEFWDQPHKFDPKRFLDSDGNLLPPEDERRQRLLTFGLGKRSCVGEILARVRTFLALTAILQNFDLKEDPSSPLPSSDPETYHVEFTTMPPPYKLRFLPKKKTV